MGTKRERTRTWEGITSSYQLGDLNACTGPALIYSLPTIFGASPQNTHFNLLLFIVGLLLALTWGLTGSLSVH